MKSITVIGEAGSGKTEALAYLVPLFQQQHPFVQIEPLNDRFIFEEEVKKETSHLSGNKRESPHCVGYYDEHGELQNFFVYNNEINRRVMRRMMNILDKTNQNPNHLFIVELGIGVNMLAHSMKDPFRWTLNDRLSDAASSGQSLGTVSDIIIITSPYDIRWERQQSRPDKVPEEAFTHYSAEGGLPENYQELLSAYGCNFTVIHNNHNDSQRFHQQLVDAVNLLRPNLLEGKTPSRETFFSRIEKEL